MKLYLVRYHKTTPPKNYLLLYLGEKAGYIVGLNSDRVPEREAQIIRSNDALLQQLQLSDIEKWLKDNVPISYSQAYCTLKKDLIEIIKEQIIKPIQTVSQDNHQLNAISSSGPSEPT